MRRWFSATSARTWSASTALIPGASLYDRAEDHLFRNRRAVLADLKDAADLRRVRQLIDRADVVLEGFRPGVVERLGLGPEQCMATHSRLVFGRMTGWGQTGPSKDGAGHDINYISLTGALHAIGRPGQPPAVPLSLVGDFGGGSMLLVTGVLAALVERSVSGRGQVIDAAMVDGASLLMQPVWGMFGAGFWQDERGHQLSRWRITVLSHLRVRGREVRRRRRTRAPVLRGPPARPRPRGRRPSRATRPPVLAAAERAVRRDLRRALTGPLGGRGLRRH